MKFLSLLVQAFRGSMRDAAWGLYWLATKRKVRGRNLLYKAAMQSPGYYRVWTQYSEPRHLQEYLGNPQATYKSPLASPAILIVGVDRMGRQAAERTIASVLAAFHKSVSIYSDASTPTSGLMAEAVGAVPIHAPLLKPDWDDLFFLEQCILKP